LEYLEEWIYLKAMSGMDHMISISFRPTTNKKNGAICRKAMDRVWKSFPEARLRIIGAKPPESDLVPGKVLYEGFFRKSNAAELKTFRDHLAKAFAIIHPTDADTTAMIMIEAAFFGCPAVSVDDFALREVTSEFNHQYLLQRPLTSLSVAEVMLKLLCQPESYNKARRHARRFAISSLTQSVFKNRLQTAVRQTLGQGSCE
jgi:glycosyltransferase involved in cell wall biosynthesis